MRIKLRDFDPSAYLDNDEVIAEYLTAALEDGDPDVFTMRPDGSNQRRVTSDDRDVVDIDW